MLLIQKSHVSFFGSHPNPHPEVSSCWFEVRLPGNLGESDKSVGRPWSVVGDLRGWCKNPCDGAPLPQSHIEVLQIRTGNPEK